MKLWGGRFSKKTDADAFGFQSSISVDMRLYKQDILGSIAHVRTLANGGIISGDDAECIEGGLTGILRDLETGVLDINGKDEDIHTYIESLLTERLGDIAKTLHTGRSRNDQVALDLRMYMKEALGEVKGLVIDVGKCLLKIAGENTGTIMPGFTHLQKAQPITLAHHLMAYFQMFKRDIERLDDAVKRIDIMPLGSGALAGTPYRIDRGYTADLLRFGSITENSIDAVSDRDFCIEACSCFSIIMMHLSRFCEEIIIWNSDGFKYIELDDSFCTGSSIMPQKKNPDIAELIRGKTGRVYGDLVTLLTMMKALPLAYNKDMQEDKEAVFDALDTVSNCLAVFTKMLKAVRFNRTVMYDAAQGGYVNATDFADYLVRKGMAFRDAHEITGKVILYAAEKGVELNGLSIGEFKRFSTRIEEDVFSQISLEACVKARNVPGGTSEEAVLRSISNGEGYIADLESKMKDGVILNESGQS